MNAVLFSSIDTNVRFSQPFMEKKDAIRANSCTASSLLYATWLAFTMTELPASEYTWEIAAYHDFQLISYSSNIRYVQSKLWHQLGFHEVNVDICSASSSPHAPYSSIFGSGG